MKVKNLFSSRKSKKKKSTQQVTSSNDGSSNDKLIIEPDLQNDSAAVAEKENERVRPAVLNESVTSSAGDNKVVLRTRTKQGSLKSVDLEVNKARSSSTSSSNSVKTRSSRRPWSFIEQLRRQDSKDSTPPTSERSSQVIEDLASAQPTSEDVDNNHPSLPAHSPLSAKLSAPARAGAHTLPRSLTAEEVLAQTKEGRRSRGTLDYRSSRAAAAEIQEHSKRPRTIDFRFFHFFKRTHSGDSSPGSPAESLSPAGSQPSSNRSSLRGKGKPKKKSGGKKKRDAESAQKGDISVRELRSRSLSDGCETSSTITYDETKRPSSGFDSLTVLNSVSECSEPSPQGRREKRVPDNGEPAFFLGGDVPDSRPPCTKMQVSRNSSNFRSSHGSDPASSRNSRESTNLFDCQIQSGSSRASLVRSSSESTESSSRRSSFVCEPRDSPLPEDSMASFDSSSTSGARSKDIGASSSASQFPTKDCDLKLQRALSNEMTKQEPSLSAQARCSQSVTNLSSDSKLSVPIPRSSSDADNSNRERRTPQPSPHQQKQDQSKLARTDSNGVPAGDMIAPPSPVLRAIGYPGVVLRRNKHKRSKQRPSSAYADERTQHVLSLNMEDLPTYSRIRNEMVRSTMFPSYEDILAVREVQPGSNRGSGASSSSGLQFASTASGRARRKGQRASAGFSNAASVDDLDSLGSSYGSKQSLDITRMDEDEVLNAFLARSHANTHTATGLLRNQEPSSKRVKTIRKSVVSLANLISPGKPSRNNKLQRSSSFKESGSATSSNTAAVASFKPYRPPSNTPNKKKNNRRSKLWCETFDHTGLSERQVKWQEAIFELYQGERDLVQDLTMAKQTYRDSMVTLKMLSDEEVALIFGKLGCLLPLHEELLEKLEQARGEDGRTLSIGYIFVEWFPRISSAYRDYCANQSDAKYALDAAVERDARVRDFLQRCLESPFSRKLDLWSYLDLPRTRLVKYPLLLSNVLKRTPSDLVEERGNLEKVMEIIGDIIERVDKTTGEQQCRYIRSKLEYLDDKQRSAFVENSRLMLCSGQLKNNRGTKLHVFLFEEALMLTRQATRSNKISYQVYRHPLPLRSLVVDSSEGDKLSGSFRGGILSSEKVKHSFRVRSEELNVTYTLQASEEHDRKQWINAILDALAKYKATHPDVDVPTAAESQSLVTRRRATYDPTHAANNKKQAARAVFRSSSDKSNRSVASSSDKSLQEESQEEDASSISEDAQPWRRVRSQTVNPSLLSSTQSSLSRKSSSSSSKSDKSTKEKKSKTKVIAEAHEELIRGRLLQVQRDEDGRSSWRKPSSRRGSLTASDKTRKTSGDDLQTREKRLNPCRRSQSLTSSPQIIRAVVSRFGNKKFTHSKSSANNAMGSNASKPPIGPAASPLAIRRTPSLQVSTIQESRSTPNLMSLRSSWRSSKQAKNGGKQSANGALRKDVMGGSEADLRRADLVGMEAKCERKERKKSNRSISEGDMEVQDADPKKRDSCLEGVQEPDEKESTAQPPRVEVRTPAPANLGPEIAITFATPKASPAVAEIKDPQDIPSDTDRAQTADQEFTAPHISTVMSPELIIITTVDSDDDVTSSMDDVKGDGTVRSASELMSDYVDSNAALAPAAQSTEVDLISFSSEGPEEADVVEEAKHLEEDAVEVQCEPHLEDVSGIAVEATETMQILTQDEEMEVAAPESAEPNKEQNEVKQMDEDVPLEDNVVESQPEELAPVSMDHCEQQTVSGDARDVIDSVTATDADAEGARKTEEKLENGDDSRVEISEESLKQAEDAATSPEEVAASTETEQEVRMVTEENGNGSDDEAKEHAPPNVEEKEDNTAFLEEECEMIIVDEKMEDGCPEATLSDIDNNNTQTETEQRHNCKLDNELPGSCRTGLPEGLENSTTHPIISQHILNNNLQTSV